MIASHHNLLNRELLLKRLLRIRRQRPTRITRKGARAQTWVQLLIILQSMTTIHRRYEVEVEAELPKTAQSQNLIRTTRRRARPQVRIQLYIILQLTTMFPHLLGNEAALLPKTALNQSPTTRRARVNGKRSDSSFAVNYWLIRSNQRLVVCILLFVALSLWNYR